MEARRRLHVPLHALMEAMRVLLPVIGEVTLLSAVQSTVGSSYT